jgi:hypothetical protein
MTRDTLTCFYRGAKEVGKWAVDPYFATNDEIVRESFIIVGTFSGGLLGLGTLAIVSGLKAFDYGTKYISQYVSGNSEIESMMPPIVDNIFHHPIETCIATTALGLGISSYFAIVGKNTPPRDPNDWDDQVWDFDHSHRWR